MALHLAIPPLETVLLSDSFCRAVGGQSEVSFYPIEAVTGSGSLRILGANGVSLGPLG